MSSSQQQQQQQDQQRGNNSRGQYATVPLSMAPLSSSSDRLSVATPDTNAASRNGSIRGSKESMRARLSREYQSSVVDIHAGLFPSDTAARPPLLRNSSSSSSAYSGLPPSQVPLPSFVPQPAASEQMASYYNNNSSAADRSSLGGALGDDSDDTPVGDLARSGSMEEFRGIMDEDRLGGNKTPASAARFPFLFSLPQRVWSAALGWRKYWRRALLALIALLVLIAIVRSVSHRTVSTPSPPVPGQPLPDSQGRRPFAFRDIFNSSFSARRSTVEWLSGGEDGEFIFLDHATGHIVVEHVETKHQTVLIDTETFRGPNGQEVWTSDMFTVSADRQYIMFATSKRKLWRHSYTAEYIIYQIATKKTLSLTKDNPTAVQLAQWSPTGHSVAFVRNNNLFVSIDLEREVRVTFDGSKTVLNGVADWVYEEEILSTSTAFYWSPKSDAIAYLRFDDVNVPEFNFPYYFDSQSHSDRPYPVDISLRYPKAGSINPAVTMHVFNLAGSPAADPQPNRPVPPVKFPASLATDLGNDYVFTTVQWVGQTLLVKAMNRVQDVCKTVAATVNGNQVNTEVVREESQKSENAWIDVSHEIISLPPFGANREHSYLDLALNGDYMHIAWFKSVRDSRPVFLTSGAWEVTSLKGADTDKGIVYFLSTLHGSTLRTVTQADISDTPRFGPVDESLPLGYYGAKFSSKSKYYWLAYGGPQVPWQDVRKTGSGEDFRVVLEDNAALNQTLQGMQLPTTQYTTIPSDGFDLNAAIMYPPNFDATKKHPVLMRVYGGPNSQLVQQTYENDLQTYVSSALGVVSVVVDGRGTGLRGKKFRSSVRGNLGSLEVTDQVNAAKWLAAQPWVDEAKIGIWGWSYGGYMSCKVVERNSGMFRFAVAVAPVTDWRFYDSMYTERYMLTPTDNPEGYKKSAVSQMDGFKKTKFLLVHGTGDDNVHFQQSVALVRKFQMAGVHNYRLQFFPDSDHSMNFDNAYSELYQLIVRFMQYAFDGKDDLSDSSLLRKRGTVRVGV
ncbi:Dipeptidyl peptidase 4 [Sorochytrium milnesiophthora]